MMHQLDEFIIVIAGNIQCTIEFLDEVYGLAHLLSRESVFGNTQIEFWNQTECHSVTMQDRLALQCPALKRMTESMTQVQRLADALLVRILLYNALLYLHAVAYHALQLLQIRFVEVEADQFFPHCFCRNQTVFQHLCIARTDVFCIERL